MRASNLACLGLALVGSGLFALTLARADEPSRIARLFRGNGGGDANPPASRPKDKEATPPIDQPRSFPVANLSTPASGAGVATAGVPGNGPVQRITPQPRTTRAATEADPILTRVTIGRSDNSGQFAMFLQIYADGTVIDSEGVHHVKPELLKPIHDQLQSGEIPRLKGHCGGPPTDYIEQVLYTVYDRSLGRIRATSFSFSGNQQGCSPVIRQLNAAVDALQMKLQSPAMVATPVHHASGTTGHILPQAINASAPPIPLTTTP